MKRFLLLSLFLFFYSVSNAQFVSLNKAELSKLKAIIKKEPEVKVHWESLLNNADQALKDTPNPADTILSEGLLKGDAKKTKTQKSLLDMQKVYALAFSYKITDEKKYLDKAIEFLLDWANRNQPQGNPINDTNLDRIIFAFDLLKGDLKEDVYLRVRNWLSQVASQEISSYKKATMGKGTTHFNNWNSHRIKVLVEIAWAINSDSLKVWSMNSYKLQIEKNLNADGTSYDFHERDALHYHVYDVDPLMVAAVIMGRDKRLAFNGYNYKSTNGSSLEKSVEWLVPFFSGEKTHAEFINSNVGFDKKRAANGEKSYIAGTLFNANDAKTSIAFADYWNNKMLRIYQQQSKISSSYPTWQFVLNMLRREI